MSVVKLIYFMNQYHIKTEMKAQGKLGDGLSFVPASRIRPCVDEVGESRSDSFSSFEPSFPLL